jgi:hypothetical protein
MSRYQILFLCLARDCQDTLPGFLSYLKLLEKYELRCCAIIGENGSNDRTRELIEQAIGPQIDLLDTKFMEHGQSRLARMAMGRQALLELAKSREQAQDYICVTDLDEVMREPPEPEAVISAMERLKADDNLFAIGAASRPVYYDLLSLRAEGQNYSGLNAEIAAAKKKPFSYFQFHQRRIYSKQRTIAQLNPIPCASSFNGFCLYRAFDYLLGSYRGHDEADVCEHVTLNLSIGRVTGKQMLIAPELFIRAPADHTPVGLSRFWWNRLKERFPTFRLWHKIVIAFVIAQWISRGLLR